MPNSVDTLCTHKNRASKVCTILNSRLAWLCIAFRLSYYVKPTTDFVRVTPPSYLRKRGEWIVKSIRGRYHSDTFKCLARNFVFSELCFLLFLFALYTWCSPSNAVDQRLLISFLLFVSLLLSVISEWRFFDDARMEVENLSSVS